MKDIRGIMREKRICVVMPTYNHSGTLRDILNRILQFTTSVIVIDDGSTDETAKVLGLFENITVITFRKNRGKGIALLEGFKQALRLGYRYAITIDSDGQHFPEDLPVFTEQVRLHPETIIIGARNMLQEGIPGKSSFGNKFSNFWMKVTTGFSLDDTQSGYRLYPLSLFEKTEFYTAKYEFEVEALVRAAWSGYSIANAPIRVYYAPVKERISHFRPFTDFFRISVLNTFLVILALIFFRPGMFYRRIKEKGIRYFYRHYLLEGTESARIIAISVGFGVFMGIVPIWGWQMAAAFAIASATGLNRMLVLIASNISIPPMIPFILFGSYAMGALLLGRKLKWTGPSDITMEVVKAELLQYILGSLALALLAGTISGLLTFALVKLKRKAADSQKTADSETPKTDLHI